MISHKKYPENKIKKINNRIRKKLKMNIQDEEPHSKKSKEENDFTEILNQLKEKFRSTLMRREKIQILTILPQSWIINKIETEFGATKYMVCCAKTLIKQKGILSTPNPQAGHQLIDSTITLIEKFYCDDEVSRIKKDFISTAKSGTKQLIQKRLLLSNLKEAYQCFKKEYPEVKVGFSKFAMLRPKNVVLAGASGPHSVCVCTLHQNVKLMLEGCRLLSNEDLKVMLISDYAVPITYHHILDYMTCSPGTLDCFLRNWQKCSNYEEIGQQPTASSIDGASFD